MALAGMIGYAIGNGHTTTEAVDQVNFKLDRTQATLTRVVTKDVPKLKAVAGCQTARADAAEAALATDAVTPILNCPSPASVQNLGKPK
jgi:hypothetical protein